MRLHFGRRLLPAICASALLVTLAGIARAAWEAPYINEGLHAAIKAAEAEETAKGQSGYGVRSNGVCMVGGFVNKGGDPLKWTFGLKDKKSYILVAAGDSDVTGLEIEGFNKGEAKAFATDKGRAPVLYLEMDGDGPVVVKVKNTEAKEARNFVVILCLESGGVSGSLGELRDCAVGLNNAIAKSSISEKLQMDQDYDDVCIAAALIGNDQPDIAFNRSFRKGVTYVMVGLGDDNCKDIGCRTNVRGDDGKDGKALANDLNQEEGAITINAFKAGDDDFKGNVHMSMNKFKDDTKPSFAVMAVLVKKE